MDAGLSRKALSIFGKKDAKKLNSSEFGDVELLDIGKASELAIDYSPAEKLKQAAIKSK